MENSKKDCQRIVDPIGIELALTIFSTSITVLSFIYQYTTTKKNSHRQYFKDRFPIIRREILRLQSTTDNLILILERITHQSKNLDFDKKSISISETLIDLREEDYIRWLDVHDALKQIDQRIYALLAEVRQLTFDYMADSPHEPFESDLISSFDRLLLEMSKMSFADFIVNLRKLVKDLGNRVSELQRHEE
jgi:hypothetical protein